ncbi:prothymosin alpha-like isoform X2 [Protopterus annectens]|uniref:prothymosin alpha-like isoform X2 n=1 Tax=Protopterus annectens TaxID=7888 RepID=UPI001CFB5F29|nr:prothymosin alpha-like isoform X2 [Protopterus annectens]
MADTAVDKTTTVTAKDLKEKKEVVEETEKAENGTGDAPANGTEENGTLHSEEAPESGNETADGVDGDGGEEEEEEEESSEQSGKRPAEDEIV